MQGRVKVPKGAMRGHGDRRDPFKDSTAPPQPPMSAGPTDQRLLMDGGFTRSLPNGNSAFKPADMDIDQKIGNPKA